MKLTFRRRLRLPANVWATVTDRDPVGTDDHYPGAIWVNVKTETPFINVGKRETANPDAGNRWLKIEGTVIED